jgi:hypothetical protein
VPPVTQSELDTEGLALDIVDDGGTWDGFIGLEIVVEESSLLEGSLVETAADWKELAEDERLEEDEAWTVMDSLVEMFWAAELREIIDAAADCEKLAEDEIELLWAAELWQIVDAAADCE